MVVFEPGHELCLLDDGDAVSAARWMHPGVAVFDNPVHLCSCLGVVAAVDVSAPSARPRLYSALTTST